MGFFSWETADSEKSISNNASSKGIFPVTVLCPNGEKILEDNYKGYGIFGGKDIYALLAKWNVPERCNGETEHDRSLGIDISYDKDSKPTYPLYPIKIVENGELEYQQVPASRNCPFQGYFY